MLDRFRVARQLKEKLESFINYQNELQASIQLIKRTMPNLKSHLAAVSAVQAKNWEPFPINGIHFSLNRVFKDVVDLKIWSGKMLEDVVSIGVDGSQINFDHHVSPRIAMVQSAYIMMVGGSAEAGENAQFFTESIPRIYRPEDLSALEDESSGISDESSISYWRWMQETRVAICLTEISRGISPDCTGCEYSEACGIKLIKLKGKPRKVVLFLDGSLIASFVHSSTTLAENYIRRTKVLLKRCQELQVPVVGVISHSNAQEIAKVLLSASGVPIPEQRKKSLIPSDPSIFHHLLTQFGDRTPLFESKRDVLKHYDEYSIGFFYLKTTAGVPLRIEIPMSITPKGESSGVLKSTWDIVTAQCGIGRGYPYILSRAHEAAVLHGSDREQFYSIVNMVLSRYGYSLQRSSKALRKIQPLL